MYVTKSNTPLFFSFFLPFLPHAFFKDCTTHFQWSYYNSQATISDVFFKRATWQRAEWRKN